MPLSVEELWVGETAGIRITTNELAHLTLRYTYTKPVKTSIPKEKRGALWYYDNKLCFVAWKNCEQDEPGDTTIHTFSCPIFPSCVKVWYIFTGTIGGVPSPSNTAIFEAHLTWPTPPVCSMPGPAFTMLPGPGMEKAPDINTPAFTMLIDPSIQKSPILDTPTKTWT